MSPRAKSRTTGKSVAGPRAPRKRKPRATTATAPPSPPPGAPATIHHGPAPETVPPPAAVGGDTASAHPPALEHEPPTEASKAEAEAEAPCVTVDYRTLEPVVRLPFARWGYPLELYEAQALAETWAAVVNFYLPRWAQTSNPVVVALLTTALVVQPRIAKAGDAKRAQHTTPDRGQEGPRKNDHGSVHRGGGPPVSGPGPQK